MEENSNKNNLSLCSIAAEKIQPYITKLSKNYFVSSLNQKMQNFFLN